MASEQPDVTHGPGYGRGSKSGTGSPAGHGSAGPGPGYRPPEEPRAETGAGAAGVSVPGAHRFGLGLAAVGRPAYINLGRDRDLPAERSVAAMRLRCYELLDAAYAAGVRYFDAARSYGHAEEYLAEWLDLYPERRDRLVIGSKWGYTYTADWAVDAKVHEVKDHSIAAFDRQLAESRSLLGDRLDLYQVHSVTPDSPLFTDKELQQRLARLASEGVMVGVSTSGPRQSEAVRAALELTVAGEPLIRSVQATWNVLEPSAGRALAEAYVSGCRVIVKEALANGRLAQGARPEAAEGRPQGAAAAAGPAVGQAAHPADTAVTAVLGQVVQETGASADAVALAAVLHQPWAVTVLSGAATTAQLASNLRAVDVRLTAEQLDRLTAAAEQPEAYWSRRSGLPWT